MTGIVVDASTLLAALMADGKARRALLHTSATLYAPPLLLEEVEARLGKAAAQAKVAPAAVETLWADLRGRIAVVPAGVLAPFMDEARALATKADAEGDEDYVAAALALDAPVWTYDDDFRRIPGIRTIGTAAVATAGAGRVP